MVAVGTAGHVDLCVGDGRGSGDFVALYSGDNPHCFLTKDGFHAPPPAAGDPTRVVTLTLNITGTDANDMWDNYRRLETKLRQARAAQGPYGLGTGVTLAVRFDAQNTTVYFDVLDGTLTTDQNLLSLFPVPFIENVSLQLVCLPYARGLPIQDTVSSTITNGTGATLFRAQVPGDAPALANIALTDVSTNSKIINRWRIGQLALPHMQSGDFSPILDATAVSPGTATTDSSSYCGASFARVIGSSSWQTIAKVTKPSAKYTSGLFDVWARVRDATALQSAPTNLTASAENGPSVRQSNSAHGTSGTTASVSWNSTTQAGNTLVAIVLSAGGSAVTHSTPTNYTAGDSITNSSNVRTSIFYLEDATAQSGSVSCTISQSEAWSMAILELRNVAVSSADAHASNASSLTSYSTGTTGSTAQDFEFGIAAFGSNQSITLPSYSNSYAQLLSALSGTVSLYVATRSISSTGTQTCTMSGSGTSTGRSANLLLTFKAATASTPSLDAGDYRFLMAARATGSGASSLTTSEVDLTITSGQYIHFGWTASTGADDYYLYWWDGTDWEYFDTGDVTAYDLTDTSGGTVANLPTSLPVRAEFRAQIGLSSGTVLFNQPSFPAVLSNSTWEDLYVGTLDLPPQAAFDGTAPPDWVLQIQGTHATLTPNLDVDAVWLIPHFWSQATSTYNDGGGTPMNLATKRKWVIDTRRDGRTSTKLVSTSDGSEAGQAITTGHLFLGPGDTTLVFMPEITGGASDVTDAKFTAQLTITPRYALVSGGPL
jgi:hypothetical protein